MYLDSNENLKAAVKYALSSGAPKGRFVLLLYIRAALKITPLETDHDVIRIAV
jgi:hypothetical protein